jgi:hypothetical protein
MKASSSSSQANNRELWRWLFYEVRFLLISVGRSSTFFHLWAKYFKNWPLRLFILYLALDSGIKGLARRRHCCKKVAELAFLWAARKLFACTLIATVDLWLLHLVQKIWSCVVYNAWIVFPLKGLLDSQDGFFCRFNLTSTKSTSVLFLRVLSVEPTGGKLGDATKKFF